VRGEFVSPVPDTDALVAVVADEPQTAGGQRQISAYICDGKVPGIAEWFTGLVARNDFDFFSVSGDARLRGTLTSEEATGTATLADGRDVSFVASPARNGGGLYDVTITPDGQVSGTSTSGAALDGTLGSDEVIRATITTSEGNPIEVKWPVEAPADASDSYTVVVTNGGRDARGQGGNVRSGFITPNAIL
jgi:hypothetical protein